MNCVIVKGRYQCVTGPKTQPCLICPHRPKPDPEFVKTHTHAGGIHTEKSPAEDMKSVAPGQKQRILEVLGSAGSSGLIAEEIAVRLGLRAQSMDRRRLYDLRLEGKVRHHPQGLVRKNARGRDCIAWVLGDDPNKGGELSDLREENKRLRELLKQHGIQP